MSVRIKTNRPRVVARGSDGKYYYRSGVIAPAAPSEPGTGGGTGLIEDPQHNGLYLLPSGGLVEDPNIQGLYVMT